MKKLFVVKLFAVILFLGLVMALFPSVLVADEVSGMVFSEGLYRKDNAEEFIWRWTRVRLNYENYLPWPYHMGFYTEINLAALENQGNWPMEFWMYYGNNFCEPKYEVRVGRFFLPPGCSTPAPFNWETINLSRSKLKAFECYGMGVQFRYTFESGMFLHMGFTGKPTAHFEDGAGDYKLGRETASIRFGRKLKSGLKLAFFAQRDHSSDRIHGFDYSIKINRRWFARGASYISEENNFNGGFWLWQYTVKPKKLWLYTQIESGNGLGTILTTGLTRDLGNGLKVTFEKEHFHGGPTPGENIGVRLLQEVRF